MAEQQHGQQTPNRKTKSDDDQAILDAPSIADQGASVQADLDDLLDDIDDVLEENAEEFVKGYVQKGGQ